MRYIILTQLDFNLHLIENAKCIVFYLVFLDLKNIMQKVVAMDIFVS